MQFLKIMWSSFFQILSVLFVVAYFLGVLNLHFSDKNNYCSMTYMFEFPQDVKISVPENNNYPQYGLYSYSEGRFTERARKMWFDGVPVLFLPGNSGSHMQARSLASVALRKALNDGYEYHFDFFTINYNEELSGLYGGILQRQTEYASICIAKILSLYKSNKYTKSVPTTIVLIGHSMGGVIAKRLLAYPSTINSTSIAITLAAPLQAPVINFDVAMNDYYKLMEMEWETNINNNEDIKKKKLLVSFGSGPRDVLMPSYLTSSNESDISALTTAVPGVWVSTDHVSIVWCKQLVMAINKFLFSIVDPWTEQVKDDKQLLKANALQFFQANRSMFLNPDLPRANVTMLADAFWYEDNRRIYQISRPEIDKTTYLMVRLVTFPQNRFVAIEAVNVDDRDWVFGCNAKFTHHTYRYCKHGVSLSELTRWTGAVVGSGKRKLATIHLHSLKDRFPDWSHVVVRISPTRKPIVLNVDINDHASREIKVDLPWYLSFGRSIVKAETEQGSLYYELILPNFNVVHEAYLLYVEPTASCKASEYHVSAELHVPWAKNHEYYHFFTHLKQSPMKLRLYMSNPNVTLGLEAQEHVKVTVLLDPQCTFTISIAHSWYHRLAQLARNYTPVLVPYIAAIILLAARSNILNLKEHGKCLSIHGSLISEGVKPYYALVFGRLAAMALLSIPVLSFVFENASFKNMELQYFARSLIVLPAYMTALGLLNIAAAAALVVMVFSSQLAHRLLFRIVWRGSSSFAERLASGLQKIPMVVSGILISAVPLSCGAASLTAGAAFYAFMLSKMYEEYLEDYVYKLMAKIASRICRMFKSNTKTPTSESKTSLVDSSSIDEIPDSAKAIEGKSDGERMEDKTNVIKENKDGIAASTSAVAVCDKGEGDAASKFKESNTRSKESNKRKERGHTGDYVDEDLNNLNFHMMLFFMWIAVALVNVPALLTWARNFKYSMVLKPDTSYHTGMAMSVCSAVIWQMEGPRRNLKYYDAVSSLLFTMAVFILALGSLSLTIVNYGVTFMFIIITLQQLLDKEEDLENLDTQTDIPNTTNEESPKEPRETPTKTDSPNTSTSNNDESPKKPKENPTDPSTSTGKGSANKNNDGITNNDVPSENCDVCNENRIYSMFKNIREKFSFNDDVN